MDRFDPRKNGLIEEEGAAVSDEMSGLTSIRTPDYGIASPARLCGWRVESGESVLAGETLAEVVAPGILLEVTAPVSGRLAIVKGVRNSETSPGDVIGWLQPTEKSE